MTLPSSGSITSADIRSELLLGSSAQFTVTNSSSNIVNWLADQNGTQVSMPSELYSKSGYKYLGAPTGVFTTLGTSHSIPNVPFGPDFTGRRLVILVECRNKASAVTSGWNLTSVVVGGTATGGGAPYFYQAGSGSTQMFGWCPISVSPSGTSGTMTFNTTQQTQCRVYVISLANISTTITDSGTAYAASTDPLTISGGVTTASSGILIAASIAYNSAGVLTNSSFSTDPGWDELLDAVSATDYVLNISIKNRQTAGSKNVRASWGGGTPQQAIVIAVARQA